MTDHEFFRQRGMCVYCHEKDAYTVSGRALCGECAAKENDYKRRKYAENAPEILKYNRNAYQYRKENRLCVKCGKPVEAGNNRVRCNACAAKLSRAEKIRAAEKLQRGYGEICYMCNSREVVPPFNTCEICYEKCKNNVLKAQAESTRRRRERNVNSD